MGGVLTQEYSVEIAPEAEENVTRLPNSAQKKIIKALEKLTKAKRPAGVEKLGGYPQFYRLRAGEYRIIYAITEDEKLVVVLIVRHRKDVYRNLSNLGNKLVTVLTDIAENAICEDRPPLS